MQDYEKHPWPATGIRKDSELADYDWGYLYIYGDGRPPEFRTREKPTEQEIRECWGHYLRYSPRRSKRAGHD